MIVHNITLSMFIAAKIIERAILEFADLRELFLVDLVEICLLLASPWPTTIYYDLKRMDRGRISTKSRQKRSRISRDTENSIKNHDEIIKKIAKELCDIGDEIDQKCRFKSI